MSDKKLFAGQTAIVTGASSGIGRAAAIHLGRLGANVVVNYHSSKDGAEAARKAIEEAGGKAIVVKGDVGKETDVLNLFDSGRREFGQIDMVINNAGIQDDAPLLDMTVEQWNKVMQSNLTSQFICIREAAREFMREGRKKFTRARGRIVCISSVHELIPWAGHVNYAASKGGMMQLMKTSAQELSPMGIRINGIAPGAIRTAINADEMDTDEEEKKILELIPYARIGHVDDVSACVEFLVSDASDYVQGHTLFVDGGMSLYAAFSDNG